MGFSGPKGILGFPKLGSNAILVSNFAKAPIEGLGISILFEAYGKLVDFQKSAWVCNSGKLTPEFGGIYDIPLSQLRFKILQIFLSRDVSQIKRNNR